MIRYTPESQLSIEGFQTPFDQQLDPSNRWVVLSKHIPWDKLANIYYHDMRSDFGAPSLSARMVIGAVIIKHILNIDDREVVDQIRENIYLQYFVGLSGFQTSAPFDASLMVSIRKRLGKDVIDQFNEQVLREAGVFSGKEQPSASQNNDSDGGHGDDVNPRNEQSNTINDMPQQEQASTQGQPIRQEPSSKQSADKNATASTPSGTLLIDATVAEQQIEYPTDLKLLNESRQHLERIIAKGCKALSIAQPRMYKQTARKKYLNIAKKKRKTKNQIRTGIRQQLQYVKRDLGYINELVEKHTRLSGLSKRDWQLLRVTAEVWRQQNEMYQNKVHSIDDRIVSIYQPHVRPIPRGKDKAATEFGSKQLVMQKDGYIHVYKIGWDNYNEGTLLKQSVEAYKNFYGCYPAAVSADQLFGNRTNRKYLKENGIRFIGKALGRPAAMSMKEKKDLQKEMAGRNAIEGKFGQGKNAYGLGKIKARLKNTSESWIMAIYFIMNLLKLAKASFLTFFGCLLSGLQLIGHQIFKKNLWLIHTHIKYELKLTYDLSRRLKISNFD